MLTDECISVFNCNSMFSFQPGLQFCAIFLSHRAEAAKWRQDNDLYAVHLSNAEINYITELLEACL